MSTRFRRRASSWALPPEARKKLPHYPTVGAMLIGRLAVDLRFQKCGIGSAIFADAVHKALQSPEAVYALLVDAMHDDAVAFYARHGFGALVDKPRVDVPPDRYGREGYWCDEAVARAAAPSWRADANENHRRRGEQPRAPDSIGALRPSDQAHTAHFGTQIVVSREQNVSEWGPDSQLGPVCDTATTESPPRPAAA